MLDKVFHNKAIVFHLVKALLGVPLKGANIFLARHIHSLNNSVGGMGHWQKCGSKLLYCLVVHTIYYNLIPAKKGMKGSSLAQGDLVSYKSSRLLVPV